MNLYIRVATDELQENYQYSTEVEQGTKFAPDFTPDLTPMEMLSLGIFGGAYFKQNPGDLPEEWFKDAVLSDDGKQHADLNYFKVLASQPLEVWQKKGWIYEEDPHGWFQWYCRYYLGRRIKEEDQRQIKRWKAIRRHVAQIEKNCQPGDISCRPKQRQALLHWAYDSRKI